ncbi:hypothetical protein NEUTE2DRAFT_84857 [Neurospora tetrasperma FGSC 2509]|nr:hypothetical protein NEUTE2DRAFT_84857 [Neurospora tetrasperma FGSC 2509]
MDTNIPSTTQGISYLPPEVHLIISEILKDHGQWDTLAVLSRSTHRLRSIYEPRLFWGKDPALGSNNLVKALMWGIINESVPVLAQAKAYGADVNALVEYNNCCNFNESRRHGWGTILQHAIERGCARSVVWLIQEGAVIKTPGQAAVDMCDCEDRSRRNGGPKHQCSTLHLALCKGHLEIAKLIMHHLGPAALKESQRIDGCLILQTATYTANAKKEIKFLSAILEYPSVRDLVNMVDPHTQQTVLEEALLRAAYSGRKFLRPIIKTLVRQGGASLGPFPAGSEHAGQSPLLHVLIESGFYEAIHLLRLGCDPDGKPATTIISLDQGWLTPLHYLIRHEGAVRGEDPDWMMGRGVSLGFRRRSEQVLQVIKALVCSGASLMIKASTDSNLTPLENAISHGAPFLSIHRRVAAYKLLRLLLENVKEGKITQTAREEAELLWRAAGVFEENLRDIQKALKELEDKLNLPVGSGVEPLPDRVSFRKELKRLSFALNRSVYLELLTRIRDGVSSLEALTSQNSDLEPERVKRSNGRLYRLMNSLSSAIYQALCAAMNACQCPTSHRLGLKLSTPSYTSLIPEDEDEDVVRNLSMKLAISDQDTAHGKLDRSWSSFMVKPSSRPRQCQVSTHQKPTAFVKSECPTKRARKTVGFSLSGMSAMKIHSLRSRYSSREVEVKASSRSSTHTVTLEVVSTKLEASNQDIIVDLCETLRQLPSLEASSCCGHIIGPAAINASATERYGLYALGHLRPSGSFGQCSFISLHEVLTEQLTAPCLFYDEDRLRLAYTLASSVLQLAGTPWLTTYVTTKDVFLIRCNGTTHFQEAFVIRQLPEISDSMQLDTQSPQCLAGGVQPNQGMLFLGIILIEIMLGTPFDFFRESHIKQHGPSTLGSFFSDYETAITLLGRLETKGGPNYKRAVERCIKCKFPQPKANLDGDEFRRLVYGHVVAPLEEDLKQYSLPDLL